MTGRAFLFLSLFFLPCVAAPRLVAQDEVAPNSARPNVVWILSDDQAWSDFGFTGSAEVRTPHLDALAAESAVFPRGYVPSSLCRPSLMSMITGLQPAQHGITGNDLGPDAIIAEQAKGKADRSPLARRLLANPVLLPRRLAI